MSGVPGQTPPVAEDPWANELAHVMAAEATALDAPHDLRDRAILRWLRAMALPHWGPPSAKRHSRAPRTYAVGDAILPPSWRAVVETFPDQQHAQRFLAGLRTNTPAQKIIAAVIARVDGAPDTTGRPADILEHLARLLIAQRLWLVLIKEPASEDKTNADPKIFAEMNATFGTNIDVQKIASWEGGQWLHGYVPISKSTGKVVGASGMTVATGYDLGQHREDEWKDLTPALVAKIKSFAGHPFRGLTRAAVTAAVAKLGPLPLLTKPEADDFDRISFPVYLRSVIAKWDRAQAHGPKGLPVFRAMPSQWQTVFLSREFNAGGWTGVHAPTHAFWTSAIAGQWAAAVANLRAAAYPDKALRNRVGDEADFLLLGMPADLPKPAAPGGSPALPGKSALPPPGTHP